MILVDWYRKALQIIHTTFDGVNEYVNMGNVLNFERTDSFSFSVFVYKSVSANVQDMIIDKTQNGSPFTGYTLSFYNEKIAFTIISSTATSNWLFVSSNDSFADNAWYHIVITYNGSSLASGVLIYVNGVSIPFTINNNSLTTSILNTFNFTLGSRQGTDNYLGKIDKTIIYNKELTPAEVTTIYNYGRKAGLVGIGGEVSQWEMDTLNPLDVIGTNHGTSNNMDSTNIVVE